MVFLLMLAIAFGTATVLLCLVIGVLEAPWPVLLGILVLGLMATRISKESHTLHQDATTFKTHANQNLDKTGDKSRSSSKAVVQKNSTNPTPDSELAKAQVSPVTTYRGRVYQRDTLSPVISSSHADSTSNQKLVYRGIPYHDAPSSSDAETTSAESSSPSDLADLLTDPDPANLTSAAPQITAPQITIVEGTYRGRHWERAIAQPPNGSSNHPNPSSSNTDTHSSNGAIPKPAQVPPPPSEDSFHQG